MCAVSGDPPAEEHMDSIDSMDTHKERESIPAKSYGEEGEEEIEYEGLLNHHHGQNVRDRNQGDGDGEENENGNGPGEDEGGVDQTADQDDEGQEASQTELTQRLPTKRIIIRWTGPLIARNRVYELCTRYGSVRKLDFNRHHGYYVYYERSENAHTAVQALNGRMERGTRLTVSAPRPTSTLWIGQRSKQIVGKEVLRERFSKYGPVEITVQPKKDGGVSRSAFATFETIQQAIDALIAEQDAVLFPGLEGISVDFHNSYRSGMPIRDQSSQPHQPQQRPSPYFILPHQLQQMQQIAHQNLNREGMHNQVVRRYSPPRRNSPPRRGVSPLRGRAFSPLRKNSPNNFFPRRNSPVSQSSMRRGSPMMRRDSPMRRGLSPMRRSPPMRRRDSPRGMYGDEERRLADSRGKRDDGRNLMNRDGGRELGRWLDEDKRGRSDYSDHHRSLPSERREVPFDIRPPAPGDRRDERRNFVSSDRRDQMSPARRDLVFGFRDDRDTSLYRRDHLFERRESGRSDDRQERRNFPIDHREDRRNFPSDRGSHFFPKFREFPPPSHRDFDKNRNDRTENDHRDPPLLDQNNGRQYQDLPPRHSIEERRHFNETQPQGRVHNDDVRNRSPVKRNTPPPRLINLRGSSGSLQQSRREEETTFPKNDGQNGPRYSGEAQRDRSPPRPLENGNNQYCAEESLLSFSQIVNNAKNYQDVESFLENAIEDESHKHPPPHLDRKSVV